MPKGNKIHTTADRQDFTLFISDSGARCTHSQLWNDPNMGSVELNIDKKAQAI